MKAMCRSVLTEQEMANGNLERHMENGMQVLLKANTTRFECQIGRNLTKGKANKAMLQKGKAEYEARSLTDPAETVFPALWAAADAERA